MSAQVSEIALSVRELTIEELPQCVELYASVMQLGPGDGGLNARLLAAIQLNGGTVTGAVEGGRVVAFAYGFLGRDSASAEPYLYSQLTVVARGRQGQGIGRSLKLTQRDRALALGLANIRWAFDPWLVANGHFNLNVLGARIIEVVPRMYGSAAIRVDESASGTDRVIVNWRLDLHETPPRGRAADAALDVGAVEDHGESLVVAVPTNWMRFSAESPAAVRRVRSAVDQSFHSALQRGLVGTRCDRISDQVTTYLFTRPER